MSRIAKAVALSVGAAATLAAATGVATADAGAAGAAVNSPGVISGNTIQVPVDLDLNLCGDTIDIIALLNPAFGTVCVND
ncbi:chaplin [Streptomyces sp. NPDC048717]|uniref:chaplin n=1 Tax=unclassified Streptomyces TaxID=2593676 RepID=UPI0034130791